MGEEINEEIVKELMKIKGEARGVHLKNDGDFVLKEKGKEGIEKLEKELEKLGCPIKYGKINQFDFYPAGMRIVSLLAIKKVFDWPDEKIEELGTYAMQVSWIIKLFAKYFFSIERTFKEAPKIWSKYFTIGEIEVGDYDLSKNYTVLKLKNFNLHPVYCRCLKGVLLGVVRMIVKSKEITCEETECFFRNGKDHKFLVKW